MENEPQYASSINLRTPEGQAQLFCEAIYWYAESGTVTILHHTQFRTVRLRVDTVGGELLVPAQVVGHVGLNGSKQELVAVEMPTETWEGIILRGANPAMVDGYRALILEGEYYWKQGRPFVLLVDENNIE